MMNDIIQFLLRHGYLVLFIAILLEQVGAPVPSAPLLLAAGALAAHGNLSYTLVFFLSIVAALAGDLIWYELGRHRGRKVLHFICRISLEPDSCVRRTEDVFAHHGGRALLLAKFIPALGIAAPPMAGLLRMSLVRFLIYDTAGSALWVFTFTGIGLLFSEQIEDVALLLARLGVWALIITLGPLAGYLTWKYVQRRRFMARHQVARIAPEEVMRKMSAGENLFIIDLRHKLDLQADETGLPGAIHIEPEEIEQRHREIPKDRDIVLYCT
jgi:membrane protein DedA with SNARE-associated domain